MHLFLLISGIVLFPKVYTLKCYQCADSIAGTCSDDPMECRPESDRCLAVRQVTYAGNSKLQEFNFQSCALVSHCINGSVNTGKSRYRVISKCCTTDLCNDQLPPELTAPRPNGKKCMGCDELGKCKWNLDCVDNEDYCFSTTVNSAILNTTIKGCASEAVCMKLRMEELQNHLSTGMSCCQGDNCNSAGSRGGSLLVLVATVVPLVLYS